MSAIIYIAGAARSGSTLLGEILGAQPGVLDGGEMALFWRDASRGNRCACGRPLTECEIWGTALEKLRVESCVLPEEYPLLAKTRARLARTTRPHRLAQMRRQRHQWSTDEERLVHATSALYEAALDIANARVLVDTSKTLPALLFHELTYSEPLTVLQLIRDPRAVAASTLRSRATKRGNRESLPPGGSLPAAIFRWLIANTTAAIGRRKASNQGLTIRYEDLIAQPASVTAAICDASGIEFSAATLVANELRSPVSSHAAVGNPRRGGTHTMLVTDERWRDELTTSQQRMVHAATWPLQRLLQF